MSQKFQAEAALYEHQVATLLKLAHWLLSSEPSANAAIAKAEGR